MFNNFDSFDAKSVEVLKNFNSNLLTMFFMCKYSLFSKMAIKNVLSLYLNNISFSMIHEL